MVIENIIIFQTVSNDAFLPAFKLDKLYNEIFVFPQAHAKSSHT